MSNKLESIRKIGQFMVDSFHYLALFGIGSTIVWSAAYDYLLMMKSGHASIKDILLLFIYLELGAMVGTYFKTHRLPVQFLIYIAITALARHLVVDVRTVTDSFQLLFLLSITGAILLLSGAIFLISYTTRRYGSPEDDQYSSPAKKSDYSDPGAQD